MKGMTSGVIQNVIYSQIPQYTLPVVDLDGYLEKKYGDSMRGGDDKVRKEVEKCRAFYFHLITTFSNNFREKLVKTHGIGKGAEITMEFYLCQIRKQYSENYRKVLVMALEWFIYMLIEKHYLISLKHRMDEKKLIYCIVVSI